MSGFVYLVTEGVHDVTFLGKLLGREHGARRIETTDKLDPPHRPWLGSFSWPHTLPGRSAQIHRLSVPAPVFYRLGDGRSVVLRNAEGIDKIAATLERDQESFVRIDIQPDAIGIVLDSDDEPPAQRFVKVSALLREAKLPEPARWGEFAPGPPRVGVFSLPEPDVQGTLEDLLLALGRVAYPDLQAGAEAYAKDWHARATMGSAGREWSELRKPAGVKKATLAAMTAVLKPGKAIQASLEDHRWVSDETRDVPGLRACVGFLAELLRA